MLQPLRSSNRGFSDVLFRRNIVKVSRRKIWLLYISEVRHVHIVVKLFKIQATLHEAYADRPRKSYDVLKTNGDVYKVPSTKENRVVTF